MAPPARLGDQSSPVSTLAFSPDGATLAGGGADKTIRLWDATSGRLIRSLAGHRDWVSTLAFSPDGATIASASCDWAHHRGRDTSRFEGRDSGAETGKATRQIVPAHQTQEGERDPAKGYHAEKAEVCQGLEVKTVRVQAGVCIGLPRRAR